MAEAKKLNQEDFQIILDVRTSKNRRPQFGPMGTATLIPEWRAGEEVGGCAEIVKQLQTIPGHRILIRTRDRERFAVVHHRMHDESEERNARIKQALASESNGGYQFGYWPKDIEFDLNNDDQYATFLWWCKKLVDGNALYLVKGTLPGYDRIRSYGDVQHCIQDMGLTTKPENKGDEKYVTTVLPKKPMSPEAQKAEKEPVATGK